MASTITRDVWVDDSGTAALPSEDGTLIGNDQLQDHIYARIDEMFAGAGAYATLTLGGHLTLPSGKNLTIGGTAAIASNATVGGTLGVAGMASFTGAAEFASSGAVPVFLRSRASDEIGALVFQNSGGGQAGFLQNSAGVIQLGVVTTPVISLTTTDITLGLPLNGPIRLGSVISPPQITTDENNYNPPGLSTARIIRIDASGGDGNHALTGLAAQPAGTVFSIVLTAGGLTISAESAGSTAANRFGFNFGMDIAGTTGGVTIWYDGASSRWRQLG